MAIQTIPEHEAITDIFQPTGPDATATFETANDASSPLDHATGENLMAAGRKSGLDEEDEVEDDEDDLEDDDDDLDDDEDLEDEEEEEDDLDEEDDDDLEDDDDEDEDEDDEEEEDDEDDEDLPVKKRK